MWPWVAAASGAEPVTETELRWMVQEVAPHVEQAAGRAFGSLPEVVAADVDRIAEVVYAEQRHLLAAKGAAADEADADARRTAERTAGAFAGKYGFLDGVLYVSVDGLADALALEGYPEWILRPALRVVVAHELVHALQDQHVDLDGTVSSAPDADAVMAMNCLVEGHAVWVHEQVGAALGLDAAVDAVGDLLGYRDPQRRRTDPHDFAQRYVYGLGRDYVARQDARGGADAVWAALAEPPRSTRAIVSPDGDGPAGPPLDERERRALARAGRRLAGKGWRTEEGPLGDYDVRDQLVRAGVDQALADALRLGFNSRLVGGATAGVEVQVLRFDGAAGARAFVQGMEREAEVRAARVGADPFFRAAAGGFDRVRADAAAREAITVSLFAEQADHLGKVWVARGADVVQLVLVNAPATDAEVAQSIRAVFRALGR